MTEAGSSTEEIRSAAIRGLRWTILARPASEMILIVTLLVLARLVSPAEFGRYAIASIAVAAAVVPGQAITSAVIQCQSLDRKHQQSAMALALLVGSALVVVLWVVASLIVAPLFDARTAFLVKLALPNAFLTSVCSAPSALVQRRLEFRRVALVNLASDAVEAVVAITLAIDGLQGASLVIGDTAGTAVTGLLYFAWARSPLPRMWWRETRELLASAVPIAIAGISWLGFQNCDYAIIGARVSPLAAGLYFRAYNTGVTYQAKVSLITTSVGFPVLNRLRGTDEFETIRSQIAQILTSVLFPLLALLAVTAPVFVPWVYGDVWSPAVVPTQILAIGGLATVLIGTVGLAIQADGRNWAVAAYGWSHFVLYAAVVFVTAPHGIVAVAIAAAIVHSVMMIVAYMVLCRGDLLSALKTLSRDALAPAVSAACLTAVAFVVSGEVRPHTAVIPYMTIVCASGVLVYLAVMRLLFIRTWRMLLDVTARLLPQRVQRRFRPSRAAESVG